MEIDLRYYNGTFNDIKDRQRNFWLGVSISTKLYNPELAKRYVEFMSRYSKDKAVILIADDLAHINYKVLNRYSWGSALRKARSIGDMQHRYYQDIIDSVKANSEIEIIRWRDVFDSTLEEQIKYLKGEYDSSKEFQEEVHVPIIEFLESKGRNINSKRLNDLSMYVLSEIPIICDGLYYNGERYNVMLYPGYTGGSLSEFSVAIQKGDKFRHIKERLGLKGDHLLIDAIIPKE